MSWQATRYAVEALERDQKLRGGARLLLMLLAERANRETSQTWTGDWLATAAGMHPSAVRRSLAQLEESGYVALVRQRGRASVVRFPLAANLSTTPRLRRGVDNANPAPTAREPRALRAEPRAQGRDVQINSSDTGPPPLCNAAGCDCQGTGWVHLTSAEVKRGWVEPCKARKGVAL